MTSYLRHVATPSVAHGPNVLALRHGEGGGRLGDVFVFIVPLLLAVEFAAGGRLFLSEVVLLLALPFLLDHARRRGVPRISHGVIALGFLWLFGLVVTDVYRGTLFDDYSRGWSKVTFLLLNFAALALLIDGRWRRVRLFAAGLATGALLQFFFNPGVYAASEPWKFGYGASVTLAGVLVASSPSVYRRPVFAAGILIAFGVINMKLGYRSLGGICLLSAVMVLFAARSAYLVRVDRRALRMLTILAASVLAGLIIVEAYGYAAGNGLLGGRAQQKYESQQSSLGIVISGRPEIIVAVRAVRDSPIVGHGSWAKDPKYALALRQELEKAGYRGNTTRRFPDLIPSHSHLFGAWVEAGILGATFWLWAIVIALRVLPRIHRLVDGRVALVAFLGLSLLWDVLFSPLGAEARLVTPFYLIVLLLAWKDLSATANRDANQ